MYNKPSRRGSISENEVLREEDEEMEEKEEEEDEEGEGGEEGEA